MPFPPASSPAGSDAQRISADGRPPNNDRAGDEAQDDDRAGDDITMVQFMRDLEASGISQEDLARKTVSQILSKFADGDVDQAPDYEEFLFGTEPGMAAADDSAAFRTNPGWAEQGAVRNEKGSPLFSRGNFGKDSRPSSARSSKTFAEDVPVSSTASGLSVRPYARSKNEVSRALVEIPRGSRGAYEYERQKT